MSNITTIKDVLGLEAGDQIKEMQFTVKSAFAPRTGTNDYGDWKVQAAMVEDDTGTIRCSFYDYPRDIRQLQGNLITVKSGKDGKGRQSGIEALDYEDRNKHTVTRQIKVNSNATIDEVTARGNSSGPPGGAAAAKQATYQSCPDEKGISIEKQVALKASVDIHVAVMAVQDKSRWENPSRWTSAIVSMANEIYNGVFAAKSEAKPEPQPEAETPTGDDTVI